MVYPPDMNRFEKTAGVGRTLTGGGKTDRSKVERARPSEDNSDG
jgi:hypothetical protein